MAAPIKDIFSQIAKRPFGVAVTVPFTGIVDSIKQSRRPCGRRLCQSAGKGLALP
jgi:hypothetical protein